MMISKTTKLCLVAATGLSLLLFVSCTISSKEEVKPMVMRVEVNDGQLEKTAVSSMPEDLKDLLPPDVVPVKQHYIIGAYRPKREEYNFRNYDDQKTRQFLTAVLEEHSVGDVISVDGLKWIKKEKQIPPSKHMLVFWEPFPNPPQPVYEKEKESALEHCEEYAEWVDLHPHLGFPPMPRPHKK